MNAPKRKSRTHSSAARTYEQLRHMAITYKFRPGERLNEVWLSKQLKVSRTPLREALNRLTMEGFLRSGHNRGFYCRPLDAKEIFDLYELRCEIEVTSVRLACERATDEQIRELENFVQTSGKKRADMDVMDQLLIDEEFHERLARISGNSEILRILENVNARIHFARWIDMEGRLPYTDSEHVQIVRKLKKRDTDGCTALMRSHISRRLDQIVEVIKEGFARIYIDSALVSSSEKEGGHG